MRLTGKPSPSTAHGEGFPDERPRNRRWLGQGVVRPAIGEVSVLAGANRALWLAAAFFGAALAPGAQAQTTSPTELQAGPEQEQSRAEMLARELAAARRDVMSLRQSLQKEQERAETLTQELTMAHVRIYAFEAQARQAGDHAAELKQTAEGGVADLQTSLQQERDPKIEQSSEFSPSRAVLWTGPC